MFAVVAVKLVAGQVIAPWVNLATRTFNNGNNMKKVKATIITITLTLLTGLVLAHSGATGIVKQRMDAMSEMGDRSKQVADMFKGKVPFEKQVVEDAAGDFVKHGSEMIDLFPDTEASRTGSSTEALPAIWEDWDNFTALVEKFVDDSHVLQTTLSETDDPKALRVAFFKATKSCSSCHKQFRRPKD